MLMKDKRNFFIQVENFGRKGQMVHMLGYNWPAIYISGFTATSYRIGLQYQLHSSFSPRFLSFSLPAETFAGKPSLSSMNF